MARATALTLAVGALVGTTVLQPPSFALGNGAQSDHSEGGMDSPQSGLSINPELVSAVQERVTELETALESALVSAYIDEAPEELQDTNITDSAVETSSEGEVSIEEAIGVLGTEAEVLLSNPNWTQTIDQVIVEQVGESTIEVTEDNNISVTADIMITRQISEEDIDWVEVIPHEVIVDPESGVVDEIIVHDLDYQLDHLDPEPELSSHLMTIPDIEGAVEADPTGLSANNKSRVAAYAFKFAKSPNPFYKDYSGTGGDCTNFVSQALYAGGWTMVSKPWVDYKNTGSWWYGGNPTASWTWTGAENFYKMTQALKRTTIQRYVSDLRVGDVLQYKLPGDANMRHSMIVTSRDSKGNLYLSYHTSNTLNKPFSSINNGGKKWFAHKV